MPGLQQREAHLEMSLIDAEIASRIQNSRETAAENLRRQLVAQSLLKSEADSALLDAYVSGALNIDTLRNHFRKRLAIEDGDIRDV
jgi:hypothetical protein